MNAPRLAVAVFSLLLPCSESNAQRDNLILECQSTLFSLKMKGKEYVTEGPVKFHVVIKDNKSVTLLLDRNETLIPDADINDKKIAFREVNSRWDDKYDIDRTTGTFIRRARGVTDKTEELFMMGDCGKVPSLPGPKF